MEGISSNAYNFNIVPGRGYFVNTDTFGMMEFWATNAKVKPALRIAISPPYPPIESHNVSTGDLEGFDVDIMDRIGTELGIGIEYTDVGFDTIIASVSSNRYDCGISAITITPERQQVIDYSVPYYSSGAGEQYAIIVSKTDPGLTKAINGALAKMKKDGTYNAIYSKWFP
jgi:ABC-type amino acid transport substrate-binding protein